MTRKDELKKIFKDSDEKILTIVEPMIDDLVFIEEQLADLRTKPFIRYHPNDPSIQKITPAGRLYKELLAQSKDIVRVLCSQLHKNSTEGEESPLEAYLRRMERK